MTTARDRARALRRHARTWFAPPGATATSDPRPNTPDPAPPATDPVTGLQTRATFTRELGRLREHDAVVVLRVTVPEPATPEEDDELEDAVRALATYLQAQRGPSDLAARLEEDEFGLLLRQTGVAGTTVAVERLRRSWQAARPDATLHLGVAHFRDGGTATLRDAYEALDTALASESDDEVADVSVVTADDDAPAPTVAPSA